MEVFIISIIAFTAMSWVFVSWLTFLTEKFFFKWGKYICPKCISFWFTFALSFDPILASVSAFLNYLIDKYITNTKITL